MKKSELKTGMIVEVRHGKRFMVMLNYLDGEDILSGVDYSTDWVYLSDYREDLTTPSRTWKIVKVYEPKFRGIPNAEGELALLWERKEPVVRSFTDANYDAWRSLCEDISFGDYLDGIRNL